MTADTAEAKLYGGGFPSAADKAHAEAFHAAAAGPERIRVAGAIGDARMREMAARLAVVFDGAAVEDFTRVLGARHGESLFEAGTSASTRPFAGEGAPWMTIDGARKQLREEDADIAEWLESKWPAGALPDPDRRGQFSFGF